MLGGGDGLLAEHTLARAGRVDEHPVKLPGHRRGQAGGVLVRDDGVRHAHSLEILAQNFSAGGDEFIGQQQALPCRAAASWLVLPPGAAQRSATRIPGCTSSSAAGAEALGSCA